MLPSDISPNIDRLISIMSDLRSQHGCPWDRRQTPESLKPFILEEAHELLEAIDSLNPTDICDEMGDLLLQIVFLSQIYSERHLFCFDDVAKAICEKMLRRHPHIFNIEENTTKTKKWEDIKKQERSEQGKRDSLKARIPNTLPALKTSQKIIKQNAALNHEKIHSEIKTATNEILKLNPKESGNSQISAHLAKTFYALAKLASIYQLDAEDLLRQYNNQQIADIDNPAQGQSSKPQRT